MSKWFLAFGLLITSIVVAFVIFSVTGVIDASALFWQWALKIGWLEPHLEVYSRGQETGSWLEMQELELANRTLEVESYAQDLKNKAELLEQSLQEFAKTERELQERISQFETELAERRKIQRLAEIYTEMSAQESARLLEEAGQELALQILTWVDERDAAEILTKLPTNLAVALTRQLGEHKD